MCYFFLIFVYPCFLRSVKSRDVGALYVGLVGRMKIFSLTFKVLYDSCINEFNTLA